MNDADLARLLSLVADSLERQNQAVSGGLVRQAARANRGGNPPAGGNFEYLRRLREVDDDKGGWPVRAGTRPLSKARGYGR